MVFEGAIAMPFDPVGSAGWLSSGGSGLNDGNVPVERLKIGEVHALDIAADASFAEGECHPGLESRDDPRFHFGVLRDVVIQAVGESVH